MEFEMTVRRWSAQQLDAHRAVFGQLYADAYAEPPYNKGPAEADRFLVRLTDQVARPGFTLAVSSMDSRVVGFALGRHFDAGEWWYGAELLPPAELLAAEKFAVSELVVAPEYRGRRLSSQLMAELLRGRTEPYAILLSRPGSLAHTIYDRWGWRWVGTARAQPHWPAVDALVHDLPIE